MPDAPPGTTFIDNRGPVIAKPDVQLVFWGREWGQGSPPVDPNAVTSSVQNILGGPYLSALDQYRCTGVGRFRGSISITNSDPPNPFNNANVQNFIIGLIDAETLPEPDEDWGLFVCVIMPMFVNGQLLAYGPGGAGDAHSGITNDYDFLDVDNDFVHLAWIGNFSGSLDAITTSFSHELVEACTDPEGGVNSAWRQNPDLNPQQGEIGDVCSSTRRVNGVMVHAYWSERDRSCIVPMGTSFAHRSPIAVVSRNPNQMDLFVVGLDGRVWSAWWDGDWHDWFPIFNG